MTVKTQRNKMWSGTHEKPRLDNTKTTRHARHNGKDFRNRGDPNLAGQLRIPQINVRGSENLRQPEFHKLVHDNKVHVILAQETLLGERSCTYHANVMRRNGGAKGWQPLSGETCERR